MRSCPFRGRPFLSLVAEFGPLLIRVSEANEIVVVDFCLLVYCCFLLVFVARSLIEFN